jgi:hypothetical protein
MCDTKFWKGNENLRSVYKNRFSKFWVVSSIFDLFSSQKSSLSLLSDGNFWLNGASKNPSFRTDFKNVHMTLVKSAPKRVLAKKNYFNN